jgi:O-antigen/teichoic acid export membrane protein
MNRHLRALNVLAVGTSRVAIASALMQLATLCAGILVANVVGVAGFGVYAFVLGSANTALILIQGSFGLLAVRYMAEWREHDALRAGQVLYAGSRASFGSGCIAAMILVGYSWLATGAAGGDSGLFAGALLAMAVAVPLVAVAQFQLSALTGLQSWPSVLRLSAVGAAAMLLLPATGAVVLGATGACWGIALSGLLRGVSGGMLLRSAAAKASIRVEAGDAGLLRDLLRAFALPAFLIALTFSGSLWFGNIHLLSQPDGARHLGLFAAAYLLRTMVVFLPAQLGTVSLTLISGHSAAGRTLEYRQVLLGSIVLAGLFASLIAGSIVLLAPVLLPILGPDFVAAAPMLKVVMAASVLEAIGTVAYQHLTSRARMWRSLAMVALPRDLVFITCVLVLVPVQQEWGLAYALLASQATMLVGILLAQLTTPGPRS